jgi:hypothetical protein
MQQVVLTRGVPRKLMGIFGMEGEDVAPRPGFSKILKSVTPKRPCLTQSFNIYIQTHKHIYIIIYIYVKFSVDTWVLIRVSLQAAVEYNFKGRS